ncbi:uncharacterized protein LOC116253343 [Nymphaea colorata]|nr:uncharacterized protein LOC116253343 [Nymphaea colorata]
MKAILWRTGSGQTLLPSIGSGSPRIHTGHGPGEGVSFSASPRNPLRFDCPALRRTRSEADVDLPGWGDSCVKYGLKQAESSRPRREGRERSVRILDEEEGEGALMIGRRIWNVSEGVTERASTEELGFGGGGSGKGRKTGGGDGGRGEGSGSSSGGGADGSRIGEYYKEMLKANPGNPLLLMNYGKYLHEVEKDAAKAEECYERAILASPGDGEVLSLYANLIWDIYRDEKRAESYFGQAIRAAPDDCYVLGSYAHFLWDAEEGEEATLEKGMESSPLVAAY